MAVEELSTTVSTQIEERKRRQEAMIPCRVSVEDDKVLITMGEKRMPIMSGEDMVGEKVIPEKILVFSKSEMKDMIAQLY